MLNELEVIDEAEKRLATLKFADDLDVQVSKVYVKEIHQSIALYAFGQLNAEDLILIVLRKARSLKAVVERAKENNPVFKDWLSSPDATITLGVVEAFLRSEPKSKDEVFREAGIEN